MSNTGRHRRQETAEVIVLDSDDESLPLRQAQAGPSSRQASTLKAAGLKRARDGNTHAARRHNMGRNVSTNDDVVDLTAAPSISAPRPLHTASIDEVSVISTNLSPAAKRRNIEIAKALEAHRQKGQQVYAKAFQQPTPEPKEVDTKPRCGICLEEMKEPACGSCGHVFCKPCLMDCLKATKKCPTCRKAMQPRTVHRIYLS